MFCVPKTKIEKIKENILTTISNGVYSIQMNRYKLDAYISIALEVYRGTERRNGSNRDRDVDKRKKNENSLLEILQRENETRSELFVIPST